MKKIISTLFAVFFLMGLFNSANAAKHLNVRPS